MESPPDRLQKRRQRYPIMLWQKLATWFDREHVGGCCHASSLFMRAKFATIDFKCRSYQKQQTCLAEIFNVQGLCLKRKYFSMSACVFDEGNQNDNQSLWNHNTL